jgi:quinol monooxygenase YgiN
MYVEIIPPARPVRTESPGPQERLTMAFVVFAQYRVRAGAEGRAASALRNMVAPTRAEPGNLDYQVFRDPKDPLVFVLFERYADESAFQAHLASPHFGTWLKGQVLPSLEDRIRLDLVPLGD